MDFTYFHFLSSLRMTALEHTGEAELRNNLDSHDQHRRGEPAASLSEHTGLLRAFRPVRQRSRFFYLTAYSFILRIVHKKEILK